MDWRAFIRLGRPHYLFKSALLYSVGAVVALLVHHELDIGWYLFGQLFVSCGHLMTHYGNEFFDLEADRANRASGGVTGGSRVLADGVLRPVVSLEAGFVLLFIGVALLAGIPDRTSRWICCAILALGWFYTAPPFKLNHRGLGELCSVAVIDVLCPMLAFHLQAGSLDRLLFLALLPNAILQCSYMILMNLFDHEGDRAAGKRTLAVALGPTMAARLYVSGHALAYASILPLWWAGLPGPVALVFGLTLPCSVWLCRQVARGAYGVPAQRSRLGWAAAAFTMLATVATNVGLLASPQVEWSRSSAMNGQALCAAITTICALWLLLTGLAKARTFRQVHTREDYP